MKVLVSSKRTQGQRDNDFCWVDVGELVMVPFDLGVHTEEKADDECGCMRSFSGTKTRKATTTAELIETDTPLVDLIQTWLDADGRAGWPTDMEGQLVTILRNVELLLGAQEHPIGSVVEFREGMARVRKER